MKKYYFPILNKKKIAANLKVLMICRGIKPADIQHFLGLSCVQTVYRWLEGINIPCVDHLYALSCLFGVSSDRILGRTDAGYANSLANDTIFKQKERMAYYYLSLKTVTNNALSGRLIEYA